MDWADIEQYINNQRLNTGLAWLFIALVIVVTIGSLFVGDLLWAGFAASVAIISVLPAVYFRSLQVMLPWEVLLLAVLPLIGYVFSRSEVNDFTMYLSVAALALIVAVEVQLVTSVTMTREFAVVFVVLITMAAAGVWGVVRWIADIYLGTGFLQNLNTLMWEFVASTAAGVVAGVTFEFYFRRRGRAHDLPVSKGDQA